MTTAPASSAASTLAIHGGAPVRPAGKKIPLISAKLDRSDVDAAMGVLESGMLRAGPKAAEFEKQFAAKTDARHALTCANGTCALQLGYLAALGLPAQGARDGQEVIVPSWTYIATASMLVACGLTPVFCECDPETYTIDVDDAAKRVTKNTVGIAATHLYGNPVDIDGVQRLASSVGLKVIYDAAQSHFATWKGKGIGAFGDAVTYSFYATKNLATGEGGMVTTNDDGVARSIGLLRSHGETEKYLHEAIGFNFRMTDVEAAIGLSQLQRADEFTGARRANAVKLDAIVDDIDGLHAPRTTPGGEHAYHLYQIRVDTDAFSCSRDEFIKALEAEGVNCGVHYPKPLHFQPAFAKYAGEKLPISERLARELFCVAVHPSLNDTDIADLGEALRKVADAYRR
ncbi:MAG: DegT/DnrJ/EryC1/StrS family aminotransferase [Phycisphaerales bacterium]